jgi:hypothetical protein
LHRKEYIMKTAAEKELNAFLNEWQETPERNREAFLRFKSHLGGKDGVDMDFVPRPGVTYSLRAAHQNQKDKELFVMVDVIEDDPRWLSICFYGEMIKDPEERADFVPEGLLGEDAMCFDLEEWDDDLITYIEARMDEAWQSASKE